MIHELIPSKVITNPNHGSGTKQFALMLVMVLLTSSLTVFGIFMIARQNSLETQQGMYTMSYLDLAWKDEFKRFSAQYDERVGVPMDIMKRYYTLAGPDLILDVLEDEEYCHDKSHNLVKTWTAESLISQ